MGSSSKRNVALVETMRAVALALHGLAEDALGLAGRVDVGGVEHGDAGVEADVEQPARFCRVGGAPGGEQLALAAEGAGAEAQHGHFKS